MICVSYSILDSTIPNAGKGLFTTEFVKAGKILVSPTSINEVLKLNELVSDEYSPFADSSVRWFENYCTISPDWPDECFVNHSFEPNGIWHLGFIFAAKDLMPGEEITVDYRHLLGPGIDIGFKDSITGNAVIGLNWKEALKHSANRIVELVDNFSE
jgi:hypothetical protein